MICCLYKTIKGLLPLAVIAIIGSEFYRVETVTIFVDNVSITKYHYYNKENIISVNFCQCQTKIL